MGVTTSVKVTGLKELNAALTELGRKHGRAALSVAMRSGAKVIAQEASNRAPVGNKPHRFKERGQWVTVQPGNLKKSIKQRTLRGKNARPGGIEVVIPLDGRAFYGKFLEWGWRSGKARRYIAPKKRFFEPAWDSKRQEALKRIQDRLRERIEYEAARLGRMNASR